MLSRTFADGLISQGPAREYETELMLYGQFVGDWAADTTEFTSDGASLSSRWDIRFEWILEGRAIQDLWITPIREGTAVDWHAPGNRYSTTIRVYDPKIDAWHIVWINPPGGTIIRQTGRREGAEIVQLGEIDASGGMSRWVYRDITSNTFRWCNEKSTDGGQTWRLVQEMRARRTT